MVLCINYVLDVRYYVLDVRYYVLENLAYELDLATPPIKVVLILCSPVSFKLINHLFCFHHKVDQKITNVGRIFLGTSGSKLKKKNRNKI